MESHGTFAKVYKVKRKSDGAQFAMKVCSGSRTRDILLESALLCDARGRGVRGIVPVQASFHDTATGKCRIVMPLFEWSLHALLEAGKLDAAGGRALASRTLVEVTAGLAFLHKSGWLHSRLVNSFGQLAS